MSDIETTISQSGEGEERYSFKAKNAKYLFDNENLDCFIGRN